VLCDITQAHLSGINKEYEVFNNMIIKLWSEVQASRFSNDERGITAIEYAIIGVAMASALFFIFDTGGFLKSLQGAWTAMSTKITGAQGILVK
jgi:pilus assembly protein Flp/PilA